jgi:hypothetical protein
MSGVPPDSGADRVFGTDRLKIGERGGLHRMWKRGTRVTESEPLPALAYALAKKLHCSVVAMRYPVGDEFAIKLARQLYEGLLAEQLTLPTALQLALAQSVSGRCDPGVPPLSVATPALFGVSGRDLRLIAPERVIVEEKRPAVPVGFPPENERFIGKVTVMTRASKALAPQSEFAGILFYGMAGAGKTACAVELAYRFETGRFEYLVWYRAPEKGRDIETALREFALELERRVPAFRMVHVVD